jgi:hypothetical protein
MNFSLFQNHPPHDILHKNKLYFKYSATQAVSKLHTGPVPEWNFHVTWNTRKSESIPSHLFITPHQFRTYFSTVSVYVICSMPLH